MPTSQDTLDFLSDALALVPEITFRPMMGEYCVYSAGRIFGLVCDDTLFFKTTPATLSLFHDQKTRAYPGSKHTCQANAEWLEDKEAMAEMVRLTLAQLPMPKPKRPAKDAPPKPPARKRI
ncbi:MAG TPA: TfoX/Sxy family protein [Elusimicrobiales bacterium]|mgnify:CR=1 FL=1|nr:TfoX/Sxy family protein [Elusimicrobiales bacterium]